MSREVVHFGAPGDNPEVRAFERRAGSAEDYAYVKTMPYDKVNSVVLLWSSGVTFSDIARQLQLPSPQIAQIAVERGLAEVVDDKSDRDRLRQRVSATLDRFLRSIMAKATDPQHPEHLAAIRAGLSITERFTALHGLNAAVEVNVNMPETEQFNRFIAAAAAGMGHEVPQEADIFSDEYVDAEVVEDDEPES